jgi:hypothetical protein
LPSNNNKSSIAGAEQKIPLNKHSKVKATSVKQKHGVNGKGEVWKGKVRAGASGVLILIFHAQGLASPFSLLLLCQFFLWLFPDVLFPRGSDEDCFPPISQAVSFAFL